VKDKFKRACVPVCERASVDASVQSFVLCLCCARIVISCLTTSTLPGSVDSHKRTDVTLVEVSSHVDLPPALTVT